MEIIKKIILFFKRFFKKIAQAVVESIPFRLVVGDLVSVCPGKRHAWYQSNVGIIRKPYKLIKKS